MIDVHPFHFLLPPQAAVLFRFALRLAADETRAEDLVQETFLKAWANRDSFTPGTELRGWLFTILRNTFYSSLRKHRREVEDVDGRLAALLFEEAAQEHSVDLNKLISAMARLPEIHRRPVVLMGAYGFSQQEAADACNCAVGTIKSRVSRGRSELGRAFGRDPVEPHGTITHPGPLADRHVGACMSETP
ncbi:sigma-70 family RNA polymerase sigma factor [Rhodovulum strictum]|uniref:Sigma-70 family RNA polymerase sigma factor n=1 Tax=Rhodovulum strictum TaxID=58314 RepID=A0A844BMR4_9RHOB|nr:sigma-70 family RNA polymerase sigma factor [Rhodovulum strictum]MRH22233.1 sigma-70 family RNA polymerase sigma factor [Rhodovulum strictum]